MHPTGGGLRRVVVHADCGQIDLALSATLPVGSLIPPIVDILTAEGGHRVQPMAIRYQLSLPGNMALDSSKTLAQLGIADGARLLLTEAATAIPPPRFDDAAEAVSASLATVPGWTRRSARLVGALAASGLACTGAAILVGTAWHTNDVRRGVAAIAAITCLTALLAAIVTYRMCRDETAGLTLGLVANGFAGATGLLAVPGHWGAPNVLLATAAAATSAVIMRATGCATTTFTALACLASVGSGAAAVGAVTATPLPAIGAATAAISLLLVEASAPVSIMLAGLSSPVMSEPVPDSLSNRAIRADVWLTSLVIAFCTAAALGAIGAAAGCGHCAGGPHRLGIALATLTGGVLLSRARAHRSLARSVPLVVAGTATLSGTLVIAAAASPQQVPYLAAASIVLGATALCLGFLNQTSTFSPVCRRSVELLEYLALAAIVPLACWICGLYSAVRGLNLL